MFNLNLFPTTEIRRIYRHSGIYFLCHEGVVVYVGQSVNVYSRAFTHTDKVWDDVYYLPCPEERLDVEEQHWIGKFKPKYNTAKQQTQGRRKKLQKTVKVTQPAIPKLSKPPAAMLKSRSRWY